tara:strand:+ start:176 stop:829 length:654 start_codon:yes stop_codon:yes gene_type:complete
MGCKHLTLINDDYRNHLSLVKKEQKSLVIYDPPYDKWEEVVRVDCKTQIAFTSPQNRHATERVLGKPRNELVWVFKDGRWVSNNLPRITHNYIYVYGDTDDCAVGETQEIKTLKKGMSSIGKDNLGDRIYTTKANKHLNSVLEYSRNMRSGSWTKPIGLIQNLIEWIKPEIVFDFFMGSGTVGKVCKGLDIYYVGMEIDPDIYTETERYLMTKDLFD